MLTNAAIAFSSQFTANYFNKSTKHILEIIRLVFPDHKYFINLDSLTSHTLNLV